MSTRALGIVLVMALGCAPSASKEAKAPAAAGATYKHGSHSGPGTGGGTKQAAGPKSGAGGFKHGSKQGPGNGGGGRQAKGDMTGHHGKHGSGHGAGTGGGDRKGHGGGQGAKLKPDAAPTQAENAPPAK
jgi:hypothetical protein